MNTEVHKGQVGTFLFIADSTFKKTQVHKEAVRRIEFEKAKAAHEERLKTQKDRLSLSQIVTVIVFHFCLFLKR